MDSQRKQSKKSQALLQKLFDSNKDKVLDALEQIPQQGNAGFVLPLLKTYMAWRTHHSIPDKVTLILYTLKTESAIPELMQALDMPEMSSIKPFVLSVFWNAGLIPSDLDVLIRHAIAGDYLTAFEVLTIVEQMEDSADAEIAQEGIFDIDEHLEEQPEASNAPVLLELKKQLMHFYNL